MWAKTVDRRPPLLVEPDAGHYALPIPSTDYFVDQPPSPRSIPDKLDTLPSSISEWTLRGEL
jgi:hypothetical protein